MSKLSGHDQCGIATVLAARGSIVEIPSYQRNYVWNKKKVETLFRDLFRSHQWLDSLENSDTQGHPYFVGVMVYAEPPVPEDSPTRSIVIDGQQRLTTFALALRALEQEFDKRGLTKPDELASLLRRDTRGTRRPILRHLGEDANVFSEIITCEHGKFDEVLQSHRKTILGLTLHSCRREIRALIRRGKDHKYGVETVLKAIYARLAKDPFVILLRTTKEGYGFSLFETLNAKGQPLTAAELTKNKILSALADGGAATPEVVKDWGFIESTVGKQQIERFLATVWTSRYGYVSKSRLYQVIADSVDDKPGEAASAKADRARDLLALLKRCASLYSIALSPDSSIEGAPTISISTNNRLHRINYIGAESLRPLLLAVMATFPEQLDKVVALLETISLRQSVMRGRFNVLFDVYCEISVEIWKAKSAQQQYDIVSNLVDELANVNVGVDLVDDAAFQQALEQWDVRHHGKAARSLLLAANSLKQGGELKYHGPNQNHVEHVLAQSYNSAIGKESGLANDEHYKATTRRLGNLTIWAASDNRSAKDDPFSKKQPNYSTSSIAITRDLAGFKTFTDEDVDARSKSLAQLGVQAFPWPWVPSGHRPKRATKATKTVKPAVVSGSTTPVKQKPPAKGKRKNTAGKGKKKSPKA
jgi:hypothetical protein